MAFAATRTGLSCRRALRGAEATTSAGLRTPTLALRRGRAPLAPCALLKVREDLRAAGSITWSQVRRRGATPLGLLAALCLRLPLAPSAAAAGRAWLRTRAVRVLAV